MHQFVQRFDHVHRQADRTPVVGHGAADGLPDPPRRVRREPEAAPELESIDGLHQTDVALLNQIEQRQAAVRVALRDRHHQPEVGFEQIALGVEDRALFLQNAAGELEELTPGETGPLFERPPLSGASRRRQLLEALQRGVDLADLGDDVVDQ